MTKKINFFRQREKEKLESRIKISKDFIQRNTSVSYMNNTKWFELFEYFEEFKIEFKLKTILSEELFLCKNIIELESTSILIDYSENFIEFLEIESVIINNSSDTIKFLKNNNTKFTIKDSSIEVLGYQLK